MEKQERIDKWLWTVRIFKTRSQATNACKKGQVAINGEPVKSSKMVHENDLVLVKKPPAIFTYTVLGFPKSRVAAKLLDQYVENLTPDDELQKLKRPKFPDFGYRDRGSGRPTKKERRIIDRFRSDP